MKGLILIAVCFLMVACQPEQVAPTPVQPQSHTITEKFYSTSTIHIYRIVNGINNNLITTESDTVYQQSTQVTFQAQHPTAGTIILTPSITENWFSDSCSVELWIDGLLVEQNIGFGSCGINYQW